MSQARAAKGRVIYAGNAAGEALVCSAALSFFGGFDLATGVVTEQGHPLCGQCVAGKILIFPTGKGSTVGSYALLRLAKAGVAPAALIMRSCDTTVAVGAIIAEIPCVDLIEIERYTTGERLEVAGEEVSQQ